MTATKKPARRPDATRQDPAREASEARERERGPEQGSLSTPEGGA